LGLGLRGQASSREQLDGPEEALQIFGVLLAETDEEVGTESFEGR
jgi:hypothetical protein